MQTNLAGTISGDRHLKWVINIKKRPVSTGRFRLGETGLDRFEKLNAARMSAAREGLTEAKNNYFSHREEKCDKSARYLLR